MATKEPVSQCVICGETVSGGGDDAVTLADKGRVCNRCASGIRMVFPVINDVGEERHFIRGMPAYDRTDYITVILDSLVNAATEECQAAVAEAEAIRADYRARYGDVKGIFLVDAVFRENHLESKNGLISSDPNKLTRVFSKQLHIITGRCVYGQVHTDDTFEVARREKTYRFKPYDIGEGKHPEAKRTVPEGRFGEYWFSEDVSCVYPGDLMIVR